MSTTVLHKSGRRICCLRSNLGRLEQGGASLVTQRIKRLSAMQETQVRSLGWEDPLEKEMATHSRTLAWNIPWMEKPGRLQSMGSQRRARSREREKMQETRFVICCTTLFLSPKIINKICVIGYLWNSEERKRRVLPWVSMAQNGGSSCKRSRRMTKGSWQQEKLQRLVRLLQGRMGIVDFPGPWN